MIKKIVIGIVSLALVLCYSLFTTIDRTPLGETPFYQATHNRLDSISQTKFNHHNDTLNVGWAKLNITPNQPTSLAGYGISEFDSVEDSVWMRALVFDNTLQTTALLAPDLLIFPPVVKRKLESQLHAIGIDAIHYSATHTHHSLGNWQTGLAGRMFAGPYQNEVVDWISSKSIEAIEKAKSNRQRTKIGYAAIQAEELVHNRLVDSLGTTDPWIRFLLMRQDSGQTAILTTFSAHPTTLSRTFNSLHRDYPGKMVDELENMSEVDFAAFMAGGVASHGPGGKGIGEDQATFIGSSAAKEIQLISNVLQPQYVTNLAHLSLTIELREPQFKVSNTFRLRPWVFDALFGEYQASISALKIGPTLLVGTPCDFSGELIAPLDSIARSANLNLMVTSFNGDYIGYITRDKWYDLNKYETQTMNWFGPENGTYFSGVIEKLIKIAEIQ